MLRFNIALPVVATALAATAAAAQDSPTLSVEQSADYGEYIVGPEGKPVYMFTTDTQGDGGEPAISCTSQECLGAWPLVTADGEVTVGSDLDESLAGTFSYEGQSVVTYNGWPLYNFVRDTADQPPQGQDVHSFGGEWYLLGPQGEKIEEEGTDKADTGSSSAASGQQATSQQQTGSDTSATGQQQDSVIATVGDVEIRGSEVVEFVSMLPPQLRSQPPQMLVPLALEQLILRELIIQEARSQNLQEDPEVVALVDGATEVAEEDALVQVWIDREMGSRVTDAAVAQAYTQAQALGGQPFPPIEAARPQIEQMLQQQAMEELRTQLREGVEVVFYDPTGRPIPQQAADQGSEGGGNQGGNATDGQAGSQSGNMSGGQSGDQSGSESSNNGSTSGN